MWVTVVLLIIFVQIVQWIFSWWSRRIDKRLGQTADTGKFAPWRCWPTSSTPNNGFHRLSFEIPADV